MIGKTFRVLRARLGSVFTAGQREVQTLLHPMRFQRARRRLRSAPRPRRLLVVCQGNLCRSPYLAALLRRMLPDVDVSSGGFSKPGRAVPEHALTIATRRGMDLGGHRSRALTRQALVDADLVVVMDENQAGHLARAFAFPAERVIIAGDLDPIAGSGRTIRDPWLQSLDVFVQSFARLDRVAAVLAEGLPPRRGQAR